MSLSNAERAKMRNEQRANILAKFVDPAEVVAESAAARQFLISDAGADVLRLQLQASVWFRPNLICSFRRETLTYMLAKSGDSQSLLNDMLACLEIRSRWRKTVNFYSDDRIRSRLSYRNGPIRQQGFDNEGRPIVWLLRGLESRARDWSSDEMQEEFARSLLWAVEFAIRQRPAGVHGVVLYVWEDAETPILNVGKVFASVFSKEAPAFLGLLSSVRFFNPSKSSTILLHLLRHYSKCLRLDRSTLRGDKTFSKWVSDPEHIPKIDGSRSTGEGFGSMSAHLTDSVDARLGFKKPLSLADIFNADCESIGHITAASPWELVKRDSSPNFLFQSKNSNGLCSALFNGSYSSAIVSGDSIRGRRSNGGLTMDTHSAEWKPSEGRPQRRSKARVSTLSISSLGTIAETPSGDREELASPRGDREEGV